MNHDALHRPLMGMLIAALSLLPLSAVPVVAQTASEVTALDSIIVSVTKSELTLEDAPIAISVVPVERMLTQGAQTAVEALQGEPGVRISYYTEGNFPIVQIRSAGDAGQFQNTDVLVLVDGIPQVNLNDQSYYDQIPFEAIERIEVVRGPTSALYGRNGVGGAINIVTRRAPEDFEATATLAAGSFGFFKPQITAGGALSDRANVLVSGSYEPSDGWREQAERLATDLFGRADIELGGATSVSLMARYFDLEQEVPTILPLLADGSSVPGIDRESSFNLPGAESRNESFQLSAVFNHAFSPSLSLTAPVYYRSTDRILDREGSFIDNVDTDAQTFDLYPFTPTADESIIGVAPRLTWRPGERVEVIGGLDFERNDANAGAANVFPAGTNFFTPITVNYATGQFLTDLDDLETLVRRDGSFESEVLAAYAQVRVDVTERLGLTLGGRFDRQNRVLSDSLRPNPEVEAEYDRFTPRVALDFAVSDDVRGYASYAQGFNPPFGGAFAFERAGAEELTPEVATNYEVGFKASLPDGRGFANLAGFLMERRDLVQTLRIENVNTQVNAGGLDVFGVEFDAGYVLGGGFTASGNYTWTDTEWQDFEVRGESFAGFEVIQNPRHMGSLAVNWASADRRVEIGPFIDYVGSRFATFDNSVELDAYTLVNAHAAFRPGGSDRVTLRVQAFNLLDEEYLTRTELDFLGNVLGGSPGRPASFQASVSVRY